MGEPEKSAESASLKSDGPVHAPTSSRRQLLDTQQDVERVRAQQEADAAAARAALDTRVPTKTKVIIALVVVGVFIFSCSIGRYQIMPDELVSALWNALTGNYDLIDGKTATALFRVRLPRVIVVMLCGAALAVSGASYQGMFKNPLVSPDLLGASAGASLGACLGLLWGVNGLVVQLMAFAGGLLAVGCSVWLNKLVHYDPILSLVLAGMLVTTLFQSGTSIIKLVADSDDKLPAITYWLMGSFHGIDQRDLALVILPMLIGFVILLSQSWKLNVLSFGEEEARSMGIRTGRVRLIVIFASTLIVSCAVSVSGVIGWVGLVIPHLARAIVGPNYKKLLPASVFVGAVYLLLVDDIARNVTVTEIPIGILTAILGVPFFVFIFKRNMKGW